LADNNDNDDDDDDDDDGGGGDNGDYYDDDYDNNDCDNDEGAHWKGWSTAPSTPGIIVMSGMSGPEKKKKGKKKKKKTHTHTHTHTHAHTHTTTTTTTTTTTKTTTTTTTTTTTINAGSHIVKSARLANEAFAMIAASFTLPALADVTSTGVTSAAVTSAASRVTKHANEARRLLRGTKARQLGETASVAAGNWTGADTTSHSGCTDSSGDTSSSGDTNGGDGGSNGSSGVDVAAILEEHNKARQEVGVPDLAWDEGLALAAQQWAAELASSGCNLEHGGADGLGQNLYWKAPVQLNSAEDRAAVQSWLAEKEDWTYSAVQEGCADGKQCGHYTQVVWRDTTHVGCAAAQCADGGGMWVCDYSPQGNMIGSTPY
ncbi:hypothetical protein CLOP_g21665, partial [Closterium sp. NIES-67]